MGDGTVVAIVPEVASPGNTAKTAYGIAEGSSGEMTHLAEVPAVLASTTGLRGAFRPFEVPRFRPCF